MSIRSDVCLGLILEDLEGHGRIYSDKRTGRNMGEGTDKNGKRGYGRDTATAVKNIVKKYL